MPQESKIPFAPKNVEVKLSHEESIDSLCREGFRSPHQMWWHTWLLERWDHPDGHYKLVAYKGGGLYVSEDVRDPQWKEIIDMIYGEDERPGLFVSENWFQLMIYPGLAHDPRRTLVQQLSPDEIPSTAAEWKQFLRDYEGMAVQFGECAFALQNGRTGETLFSNALRKNPDGSVGMVGTKRPKRSR
jgi:hypothetical protein